MNEFNPDPIRWSEQLIIIDAEYIDEMAQELKAFLQKAQNLTVHRADLAQLLVNIAADSSMTRAEHSTQVVLVHEQKQRSFAHFLPQEFAELQGVAFADEVYGEFLVDSVPAPGIRSKSDLLCDVLQEAGSHDEVQRIALVASLHAGTPDTAALSAVIDELKIHHKMQLFSLQAAEKGLSGLAVHTLVFALLHAFGVNADDLHL